MPDDRLFSFPEGIRGQLAAWAESVCEPVEPRSDTLDEWAADVVEPPSPKFMRPCEDCGRPFFSSLPGITTCGVFGRCDQ